MSSSFSSEAEDEEEWEDVEPVSEGNGHVTALRQAVSVSVDLLARWV